MKKMMAVMLMGLMTVSTLGQVAAEEEAVPILISEEVKGEEAVPVLISEEVKTDDIVAVPISAEVEGEQVYMIKQNGSEFSVIVEENASTGYLWSYEIKDPSLVEFISEEVKADDSGLLGAPSEKTFTFKVLEDGVTTITFKNTRSFDNNDVADEFRLLAYKNGETVIVEEDGIVTIQPVDSVDVAEISIGSEIMYNGEAIESDVEVKVIDGVTMVPLRSTLEALGYTVTWNGENMSVEISKGAIWTSITIGENAYFKNRMAHQELTAAPLIVNDRTLVPLEFFGEIMGHGISIDSGVISIDDNEVSMQSGFVKDIQYDETGGMTLTLTSDMESDDINLQVIIHTSNAFTIFQKDVVVGDSVKVITSMVMTMSLPGQTAGYVVY